MHTYLITRATVDSKDVLMTGADASVQAIAWTTAFNKASRILKGRVKKGKRIQTMSLALKKVYEKGN